jgi:alpha-ketoglutarate-dependent taurine dioxygenase
MSSRIGAIQRPLGQLRATTTWRQGPRSGNGTKLFYPLSHYRYNASIPKGKESQPGFQLKPATISNSISTKPKKGKGDPTTSNASESDQNSDGIVKFGPTSVLLNLNGRKWTLDYAHLRDSCTCPRCVDPSTKQRNIQTTQLPLDIQPHSYEFKDGSLLLQWNNDISGFDKDHTSVYSKQQLAALCPKSHSTPSDKYRIHWDRELFEMNSRKIDWNDYINNEELFAECMRDLSRYGLVILSGVPESRDMVEKVATRMGPLRNSFYGETWDVRSVPQPKNVAYTDQFLNFHMDLLYMRDPPGYQLLHCLRNSCSGGESLFSDAFRAAEYFHSKSRGEFRTLSSFEVNYGYNNMNQSYANSWPTFELLPESKRGSDRMGLDHVNYSPPFQAPFRRTGDRDWNRKYREYVKAAGKFAQIIEDPAYMYEFKLNPGDCVIFENRRVVHARRAFDTSSGERWLAGAYVDEDAVRSKFRVLANKYPALWEVPPAHARDPKDED